MPRTRSIAPPATNGSSAAADSSAPTGRDIPAQGNALGNRPPTNPSPEGAAQEFSTVEIPHGWWETTFGELVKNVSINDKKLPAKQYAESGKFPVVDQGQKFIGGYSDDEHRVISDELPLIVFGDHTRIFKYLDRAFVPGADGIKVLKPIGVDAKWLFHIAHALNFPDKGYARHFQHLKQANVFVPPLPEQRRIVARIEELFSRLDAGVAALRHAKAQLQRYRQSVLAAAVTGQLTQAWREQHPDTEPAEKLLKRILKLRREQWNGRGKYKEPASPNVEGLPEVPASWQWTTAEAISDENRAITYGVIKLGKDFEGGVPTLRSSDVRPLRLELHHVKAVDPSIAKNYKRTFLQGGELLVTVRGTLGGICVVPAACKGFNVSREVAMIAPVLPDVGPCIALMIGSQPLREWMLRRAKGIAYLGVNIETLKQLPIPLPPLEEQHQIVAEVEARTTAIDHLEAELVHRPLNN